MGAVLSGSPRTDPGERNYRTGLLPQVMTHNRCSGYGCRMRIDGNPRAARRSCAPGDAVTLAPPSQCGPW